MPLPLDNMKPLSVLTAAAAVCLFMIPIGYEFDLQNVVHSSRPNLTRAHTTLLAVSWPAGAFLGSLATPATLDWFSIKSSLFIISNAWMMVGGVLSAFSPAWTLILGRLIFGIGTGLGATILPLYTMGVYDSWLLGGWLNGAFWLGCSVASGLGLDTVLGGEMLRPYWALIGPFMVAMTIILTPLFPQAPPSAIWKRLESDSLLIEWRPPSWSWKDSECRHLAIGSVLTGLAWASFAPTPLFSLARPILTTTLYYSQHTAGAIEACVAVIYACSSLLSFTLLWVAGWKRKILVTAAALSWSGYLLSAIFAALTSRAITTLRTGEMGVLFSFLVCALAYHCVLAPHAALSPFAYCSNARRRVWCYALLHASFWMGFLIWTQSFSALASVIGAWSLWPFLAVSICATLVADLYWRRRRDASPFSHPSADSESRTSVYGTFAQPNK